ncbi:MAG: hypothetical protein L6Q57_09100 [Alphaproteobacteria bacterium]|nr:hypothetical protein [Alphaproteobacteria bacterium]
MNTLSHAADFAHPAMIRRHGRGAAFRGNLWFYGTVLAVFIFTAPFYIMPSGYPQPADALMTVMLIPAVITLFLQSGKQVSLSFVAGMIFVSVTIFINLLNAAFFPDIKFLLHSMIYLFNFMVFLVVVELIRSDPVRVPKIMHVALVSAIIFQVLWVILVPEGRMRASGTFNGTNQLAYWCLLSLINLTLLRNGRQFGMMDYVCIVCLLFMQTLALSKAALVASALALLVLPMMGQFTQAGRYFLFTCAFFSLCVFLVNPAPLLNLSERFSNIENTVQRLENIGTDPDDNLEGRGYTRLFEYPEYVILGAGEGAYTRFSPVGKELHSGVATIIFSYGLLGTLAFAGFLAAVLWRQHWANIVLVGCVMLYGLTHQNIRFTEFWICLALVSASPAMMRYMPWLQAMGRGRKS